MAKKTRAQRREDRRDSLKEAAIEVFSTHGYHAAKVSQIVETVGVAQGTFYLYYESKEQIFGELLSDFLQTVVGAVSDWEPASLDSQEVLREELHRVGMKLTEVLLEHRGLAAIFFREGLAVSQDFDEMIEEFYSTLAALMTNFNRVLHERGIIPKMNFEMLAYMTIGSVERIIMEYIVTGSLAHLEPTEIVDHLIGGFLTGVQEPIETSA